MSLFDKLTEKMNDSYVVTYLPSVKRKENRFRTSADLREFLKKNKFIKSRVFLEDNNLYVVYTSRKKAGFTINSSEYLKILPFEKYFKRQLELFNNTLTFKVAEQGDDYIILKLPTQTISSSFPNAIKSVSGSNNGLSEQQVFDLKYRYHVGKIPATTLAKQFNIPYSAVFRIAGKHYS